MISREEKIKIAIENGINCDINTGKVYGVRGKEIIGKTITGYIIIPIKKYRLYGHHFVFYKAHGKIVEYIDHINGNKSDNRIENLREVTHQQNHFNTKAKGYTWFRRDKKWRAHICINRKVIHLGYFDKKEDAHQAYLNAKKIYHII